MLLNAAKCQGYSSQKSARLWLNTRSQLFIVSQIIYECTAEFGNRCCFNCINFYGHEFCRTVRDIYLRVTFISGSESHMVIFTSYFQFPSTLFRPLRSSFFSNFQKVTIKKQRDEVYILLPHRSQELRRFWGNFLEFLKWVISSATVNDYFSKFFNRPFTALVSLVQNLY